MIQLNTPHVLFSKQKLMRVSGNVEKKISEPALAANYRAVFIYSYEKEELSEVFKEMFGKLSGACKFKPEQTLFINSSFNPVTLGQLQAQYKPELILVFGEMLVSRNLAKLKKHYPYDVSGAVVIKTETIENLELVKGEKLKLWGVLQQALKLK